MEQINPVDIKYRQGIMSNIELANGKMTQLVIFFNHSEVNFEELNAGLNIALSRCKTISKFRNSAYSIGQEGVNEIAKYPLNEK